MSRVGGPLSVGPAFFLSSMKRIRFVTSIALGTALLLVGGCGQSGRTPEPPPKGEAETSPAQTKATEAMKQATTAAEAVKDTAKAAVDQAASKAQELITQAKGLVDAKKYADASNILQQLAALKLTPEQQKLVEDLKATIQQALAKQATSEGVKAVGGLLDSKKK